ncbi:glycosyltransferase family 9 protein [Chitinolyticbacter meiyuanensis]|uniref:glycosyltransferase family 9 protein n=1 Tax=Chitinolyticbacter meiyuanensis TaxID=682798 RepID=UPI0011E5A1DE|nr:glycosyltransferase family 9 protein [Chitinolyticbacter meiyuanensis]
MSRAAGRLIVFARALPRLLGKPWRRRPTVVRRILIAHHLLLGDTLMLTPLLAKLRRDYPDAAIVMACPKAVVPLYAARPYQVDAQPFDPRDAALVRGLIAAGPFDLAFVPGDNRYSWLALAAGSRWIVAHAGDTGWKNLAVDELHPYPQVSTAWGDIVAQLQPGAAPAPYAAADWPAPPAEPFTPPVGTYAVLHLGASSAVKTWPAERWRALAQHLALRGIQPVWSAGGKETALIEAADPERRFLSVAGALDLPQLWHLLAGARLLVCPDTGVAHLGRIVGVPTLTLFGPGSPEASGGGEFWRQSPGQALQHTDMPCRNQQVLFRRQRDWLRRCGRGPTQCLNWDGEHALCMRSIDVATVLIRADQLIDEAEA